LVSERGDLVLTADARIDNRDDLIRSLTTNGHLAESDPTDADLILNAYECWGTDCPTHLIGDFAFAIWDAAKQCLFAARDPLGMRSFYYRAEPRRFIFATELKQVLAVPNVQTTVFEPAAASYLAGLFGPPEWTSYQGIFQLSPAHALLVDAEGHSTWRYWDIDPAYQITYANEDEYAEHFLEIFKEAVHCRLRSVKPVGVFLSGGMDSGSVTSTAGWLLQRGASHYCHPLRAYCYAFDELTQCDERHISNEIARYYGLPVTSIPAETFWPLKGYPADGPDRDDPLTGAYQALINHTLNTARAAGVQLMFTGRYGDLMAGGGVFDYPDQVYARQWSKLWGDLRNHSQQTGIPLIRVIKRHVIKPLIDKIYPNWTHKWLYRVVNTMLKRPKTQWYPEWIRPEFAERVGLDEIIRKSDPQTRIKGFARRERYKWIVNPLDIRLKVWAERIHAKLGLAYADPWCDRRIFSFAMAVPQRIFGQAGEYKPLVKRAMNGIMPEVTRQVAGKTYPEPLYKRAIVEQARETVLGLLAGSKADDFGYLDEQVLRQHYDSICNGADEHHAFWWALTLEMWLRQHWS
ncbi:MAG: hypothetical protein JSV50_19085, partial [Desulfobacteraceae bacterium]